MAQLSITPTTFSSPTLVGSPSSQAPTVTIAINTAGTVQSFGALTSGLADPSLAEFGVTQSANCPVGSPVSAGQFCQVTASFSPRFPGIRQGGVELLGAGGQVLGRALVSGIGKGSLPVLVPGDINTVAGDSQWIYQGDGVLAINTSIYLPQGIVVDAAGGLYLCDTFNNRVRYVDPQGKIHTIAGNGTPGSSGDNSQAQSAELNLPSGLALDGEGNLYIADTGNNVIRRVDALTQIITTVAGQIGISGYAGDGGAAAQALLKAPQGLALTAAGDLLIADSGNSAVRQVTFSTRQINTVAGTGTSGYSGDGGPATQAQLNAPFGVAVRVDGAIAIADTTNNVIRLVDTSGVITTVAGDGQGTYGGDGLAGGAKQAHLYSPASVAFDPAGDLFIADSGNNRIRGVFGEPGTMTTLVGNDSQGFAGDGGPSDQASLYGPEALYFDQRGNLWLSDRFHHRVREVNGSLLSHQFPAMKVGKLSAPFAGTLYNGGNANLLLQVPTQIAGLIQAELDSDPRVTTCDSSPLAPSAFCVMGIEFAPTQVNDDDHGSVTWVSNAPNVTPVDALDSKVLSVEPTVLAISSSLNPGVLGQPVTLTGSVALTSTGKGAGLTGTVTFSEGSTPLCSPQNIDATGNATCLVSTLSLGSHTFTATYSGDASDAAATSAPYTEIIKQQPALALAVSTSPAIVNSNVSLTLVATDTAGTGTPTGVVTFYDGGVALASVPLNGAGVAQFSTQMLGIGVHSLSAQYSGDAADVKGTSNIVAEQITPANTVTVLASNSSDPMIGSPLILVATVVSDAGPGPTGTVQFIDGTGSGAAVIGVATLSTNGTASLTVNTLLPGAHSIVATYGGDASSAGSSSAALPELVKASGISLQSSSNPSVSGQNVVLSAQLNAAGPLPPTGMVIFRNSDVILASIPINGTGLASFTTQVLSVGTHAITASFAGDSHYAAAGGQLTQIVMDATTAVTLTASANPTIYGQALSLQAAVTSNGGIAGGTVNFTDGNTVIGSAQLDGSGVAVLSVSTLTPGMNMLVASYAGDGKASASSSVPIAVIVKQITALAVSANSDPAQTLSAITFTASVATPGAAATTGTVSFHDAGTDLGTAPIDATGHATLTLPQMSAGDHIITASYPGDGANLPSTSGDYRETVQQRPTSITVTGSSTDATNPQQITLIAVVKGQGSVPPGGTVTFTNGGITMGQATVDNTGVATITVIFQRTAEPIVASYSGDVSYAASQSSSTNITAGQPAQFTIAASAASVTLVTHQHTTITVSLGSVKGFTDNIALGCLGLPFAGTCTFTPSQVKLSPDATATSTLILDTGDPLGAGSGTSASLIRRQGTLLCGLPFGLLVWLLRHKERNAARRKLGTLLVVALAFALTTGLTGCSGLTTSGTPPGTYKFTLVGTGQGSGTTQTQIITLVVTQ